MKKLMVLAAVAALMACNREPEKPVIINNEPDPVVVEKPAPPPAEEKNPDGTSIKIGEDGVSYEKKDGDKESSVKISGDSTSVEIKKPE